MTMSSDDASVTNGIERGCECPDCDSSTVCTGSSAPVAFLVERDGEEIKVCTRCVLPFDKRLETLVDEETPRQPFIDYDAIYAKDLFSDVDQSTVLDTEHWGDDDE